MIAVVRVLLAFVATAALMLSLLVTVLTPSWWMRMVLVFVAGCATWTLFRVTTIPEADDYIPINRERRQMFIERDRSKPWTEYEEK